MDENEEQKQEWVARRLAARDDVLAALVAGDRTEQQVADRFGIAMHPVFNSAAGDLLDGLVVADLACMKVVDRTWHYIPTRKGRERAAQLAIEAVVERRQSRPAPAGVV